MRTGFFKRVGLLMGAVLVLGWAGPLHGQADLAEGIRDLYRGNYEAARSCAEQCPISAGVKRSRKGNESVI